MDRTLDVLLIHPDSSAQAYQGLATTYSAIEPPTWALLLAQSCRAKGFGAAIMDCDAEKLSLEAAVQRARDLKPRLVLFVVYGQNPNSGTTSMIGATRLAEAIKQDAPGLPIGFVGSHTSALPREVLALPYVDIVLLNEGVYALHNLLRGNLKGDLAKVAGIGYKKRDAAGKAMLWLNPPQAVVPQELMDQDLPGYAWDLLPYRERPLDLYRAHFWHAGFDHAKRTPFAAIYTSLGCNFGCDFCMINIVNRQDNGEDVHAAHSRGMRFWSPGFIAAEMEKLATLGVQTLRISDEMFFLNRRYYEPLLQDVTARQLGLNMWTYSRVDTVRPAALELFKNAGVNWLALGIEAGSQTVRKEVSKGTFQEVNIREVCKTVRDAGIHVISNYIFGFPDDTLETMQQTLDLALELNTEMANMYPCQALPGSPIYRQAIRNGWKLPESYAGYAFLSYECEPLATKHVSAADVLRFRDNAFQTYFTNPAYLDLVETTFGAPQRRNVEDMTKIRLKRKLLGD
ncbi:MAG: cobalamin-dependent protein [Piscinibacter sp.]|uniref:B12-binding domain-containing radical SAM protein n=1 Tax=Piscinibacter sp. TaxID=1903157 RepID=UPI002584047C|nr:radical SAM protein [Piscinibacter sp.]MCW5666133.1 cobalamin-dependent protein [Piscinibacter sp.]